MSKFAAGRFSRIDLLLSMVLAGIGIYIFYPGAMSLDSIAQWLQVVDPQHLTTWHPPVMVYLWSFFNKIMPGTQGLLFFHYIVYFLSLYILANVFFSRLGHRILYILIIGLFPPVFFFNGVIWKDVSMLIALSMSFALLFKFEKNRKTIWLLLSICFLFYGTAVRHNAIICFIPYIIYTLSILIEAENRKKTILIAVLTPILCFGGIKLTRYANSGFVKEWQVAHNMENSAFIWDLWVMSIELNENIIPQYIFHDPETSLTVEELKSYYVPYTASVLWLPMISRVKWQTPFPDKTFKKDFIKAIIQHPLAYLKVRTRIVLYMLGIKKPIILPYHFKIYKPWKKDDWLYEVSKDLEFRNKEVLQTAEKAALFLFDNTPLYLAWVYFILMLLQFILIFLYRKSLGKFFKQYLLVLSTGTIYWLPFIIISAAADFRYLIFTVFCSVVMLPVLVQSVFNHHKGIN
jgi:hypothetical protein